MGGACCERLAFLGDERHEGFDGHTAFVDSFVYPTWLDKNGFTCLENFRRLAFLLDCKFTFEYVTHECAGVPVSAFATTHGDGHFHEHYLIARNGQVLLEQDFPFDAERRGGGLRRCNEARRNYSGCGAHDKVLQSHCRWPFNARRYSVQRTTVVERTHMVSIPRFANPPKDIGNSPMKSNHSNSAGASICALRAARYTEGEAVRYDQRPAAAAVAECAVPEP